MFEKVREIICEKIGVDESEITMNTSFRDDLDLDSLTIYDLVVAFEDEFNIEIDDEQSENIETVGNVVTYLENLLEK